MSETWSTTEWGPACGAKPSPSGGGSAGTVTIVQQGSELAFSGAGRSFSTASCWEPNPSLKRSSHSGGTRGWTTTCASAPGDPRVGRVTTRIVASDDAIVFSETGSFEGHIEDSNCKASVSRSRSYKLIRRAGDPAPAASASAAAPPEPAPSATAIASAKPSSEPASPPRDGDCGAGAKPARFEVRPARKLLRPGDAFTLRVEVLDASSCRLAVTPELKVDPASDLASHITIEKLTVIVDANAKEGSADLTVSLGGTTASVSIEVTPPEKYAALLEARGLDARGEEDRPVIREIEARLGSAPSTAEDTARSRRITFLVIVVGVAAALAVLALGLVRRGRRAAIGRTTEVPPPPNVTFFDVVEPSAMECPKCGRVTEAGQGFCPMDGTPLVPSKKEPPPKPAPSTPPPSMEARPAAAAAAPKKRREPDKICPTCGERFASDAGFCGRDGTQLVPVN